jgi:hypothetical protein
MARRSLEGVPVRGTARGEKEILSLLAGGTVRVDIVSISRRSGPSGHKPISFVLPIVLDHERLERWPTAMKQLA